jgi:acyl-coenzyme A thioesterase PaaI-like protein
MVSKHYARVLDIFMSQSHKETFGKFLTPSFKLISHNEGKGFSFSYKIPQHLCRYKNLNEKPEFTTAGIMSVFDQLSTYGIMAEDKYRPRGGVSVLLSTELIEPSYADQDVVVVSKCDKIGRSLGFSTMELHATDGTVLARGKHIKYLPLGMVWDVLTHPKILPAMLKFHDTLLHTPLFARLRTSFTNIPTDHLKTFPECVEVGSVFAELGLVSSVVIVQQSPSAHNTKVFELVKQPHLNNNIGKMHGGAVAAVVEQACYLSRGCLASSGESRDDDEEEEEVDSGLLLPSVSRVRSIEVRYESAMEVSCAC